MVGGSYSTDTELSEPERPRNGPANVVSVADPASDGGAPVRRFRSAICTFMRSTSDKRWAPAPLGVVAPPRPARAAPPRVGAPPSLESPTTDDATRERFTPPVVARAPRPPVRSVSASKRNDDKDGMFSSSMPQRLPPSDMSLTPPHAATVPGAESAAAAPPLALACAPSERPPAGTPPPNLPHPPPGTPFPPNARGSSPNGGALAPGARAADTSDSAPEASASPSASSSDMWRSSCCTIKSRSSSSPRSTCGDSPPR